MRLLTAFLLLASYAQAALISDTICPAGGATHKSVASGRWDDPATWQPAEVPPTAARVLVSVNTVVERHVDAAPLWVRVEGTLKQCRECPTIFSPHTICVVPGGYLEAGTVDDPVIADAVIEFVGTDFLPGDDFRKSLGLFVEGGRVRMCGVGKTHRVKQYAEIAVGSTTFKLSAEPSNWRVGDVVLVAGTDSPHIYPQKRYQSEYKTIAAIDGRDVTVDTPFVYRHFLWHPEMPYDVLNTTRNLTVRSANPVGLRGHMMFMMGSDNDLRHLCEISLGRTDKSRDVTDPRRDPITLEIVEGSQDNPRGGYADHNHKNGQGSTPSVREDVIVRDSRGWGLVNHASNCRWDRCIALECFGSGFVTEEGQEVGWMRDCVAGLCRGQGDAVASTDADFGNASIGDFGRDGSGFWLQGPLVEVSDCSAFDCSGRGFAIFNRPMNNYPVYGGDLQIPPYLQFPIETDGRYVFPEMAIGQKAVSSSVGIRAFRRNSAYQTKLALQAWCQKDLLTTGGRIERFDAWGRGGGMQLEYANSMDCENCRVVGDRHFRPAGNDLSIKQRDALVYRFPKMRSRGYYTLGIVSPFFDEKPNDPTHVVEN